MSDATVSRGTDSKEFQFSYKTGRNISVPDGDNELGVKVFTGFAPAASFFDIPEEDNVRAFFYSEADGRQRMRLTEVHRAIESTLENRPDYFPYLNGGIVIVTKKIRVDDKERFIYLDSPQIINGSQTRGMLERYHQNNLEGNGSGDVHVRYEIVCTEDQDLVREISVARNRQNAVKAISIAGHQQQLKELHAKMKEKFPGTDWVASETDAGEDTEKLLQLVFTLLPDEIYWDSEGKGRKSRTACYSGKAKWLKEFSLIKRGTSKPELKLKEEVDSQTLVEEREKAETREIKEGKRKYRSEEAKKIYSAILDLAPAAWSLYNSWRLNQNYMSGLRAKREVLKESAVRKGKDGRYLADGMIYPIIYAHSRLVKHGEQGWYVDYLPEDKKDWFEEKLIENARTAYRNSAYGNAQTMGKQQACYDMVAQVASLVRDMNELPS